MKHCPSCGSSRYSESITIINGRKFLMRGCKKCGFSNKKEIKTGDNR